MFPREFQSTRPHGARLGQQLGFGFDGGFNPRARMGRDAMTQLCARCPRGFNPRARMGRDLAAAPTVLVAVVSIHAPAWGATSARLSPPNGHRVSIHAPAWGATTVDNKATDKTRVSIHAPAWGATVGQTLKVFAKQVSIHAPAWGATAIMGLCELAAMFQSTRPHGARHEFHD